MTLTLLMLALSSAAMFAGWMVVSGMDRRGIEQEAREAVNRVALSRLAVATPSCDHRRIEPVESCVTGDWLAGICLDCNATIRDGSLAGLRSHSDWIDAGLRELIDDLRR